MKNMLLGMVVAILAVVGLALLVSRSWRVPEEAESQAKTVVCYAALDEEFSRPILEKFEQETGIKVLMKFDTESTKSVGLANAIVAQKDRPQCDVFWNNEILNTIRLKQAGVLARFAPQAAQGFPAEFRDPDQTWTGFAARARVLLVNRKLVKKTEYPRRLRDLLNPKWQARIGIAKPLFGTTATHLAVLYAKKLAGQKPAQLDLLRRIIKQQQVRILGGNKGCAQAVSAGTLAMAFTDTDDAIIEQESGKPVDLVFLDGAKDQVGVMFIPNTLSIVKGGPHPQNARRLVEYLLSAAVEVALAKSSAAQIPVNPAVKFAARVPTPKTIKAMKVDWDQAAASFDQAARWVKREILSNAGL